MLSRTKQESCANMLRSFAFCLTAAFTLLTHASAPEAVGPELLTNGGFEHTDAAKRVATSWTGFSTRDWGDCAGEVKLAGERPHTGRYCLEMAGVKNRYAAMHRKLPVSPDQAYLLTAWVRTELYAGESAFLVASWSTDGKWLQLSRSRPARQHRGWTCISLLLPPATRPSGAKYLQPSFRVTSSSGRGRAWVDDVSLRECRLPPPPLASETEPRRLLDMARELLVECRRWEDRLSVLKLRRADLAQLVEQDLTFSELVRRYGRGVSTRRFLTHLPQPHSAHDAAVPTDEERVRTQVGSVVRLPALRGQCFGELQAILVLKRQLRGSLRRFYLWAQLAAMRGELKAPERLGLAVPTQFSEAQGNRPANGLGILDLMEMRTHLDLRADVGTVSLIVEYEPTTALETLDAGLFSAGGEPTSFASTPMRGGRAELTLRVPSPHRWFPDAPHLYTLQVGLFRDGLAPDWHECKVAFRDVHIAECDVSSTMRHAWQWATIDYTFTINGQPYFPTGTVCGALREPYFDEAADLFGELWLDFQRTYGTYLPKLDGGRGDIFAERGLTFLAALGPNYRRIRQYESSRQGFDEYREKARDVRRLASHPALLTIEVGNEAELSVWGADLPSVYGRDLWHVFNEAAKTLYDELSPDVPVGYVRAAHFSSVLPAPRTDYSGVNQYTGRYWGRRCTIGSDLGALALAASQEHKPIAITEWNGPKYSWATRGVSGVHEEGAAQYIFEYFQNMLRTPTIVLSTEFVLNWVVTPLEDLTTVSLAEGLKRRAQWRWGMQKGTPWYPHVWPDLLTDTPARRAMRGFQSPLYYLCAAPGPIIIAASEARRRSAERLVDAVLRLGRSATYRRFPSSADMAETVARAPSGRTEKQRSAQSERGHPAPRTTGLRQASMRGAGSPRSKEGVPFSENANLIVIGGLGRHQPGAVMAFEKMGVIGRTTDNFPAPGKYLIQRRVNPHSPDRFLVVVTAADEAGMERAVGKLLLSASGLAEALARQASCRRALALVDDRQHVFGNFATYVMELPTRGSFEGRDDLRTRLHPKEFLEETGALRPCWWDLGALVVATCRELEGEELHLIDRLASGGVNVVWSSATLAATPAAVARLGVSFGEPHELTRSFPVQKWAQKPLAVPDLGNVAAERVEKFAKLEPGSNAWRSGMMIREVLCSAPWRTVASTSDAAPVVVMRAIGTGRHWVFGCDLSAVASVLCSTTRRGINHGIYDRDTACGLERIFRLMSNAAASGQTARPAASPRLRAVIETDRATYDWGDTLRARVCVRDAEGQLQDAAVRIGFASSPRFSQAAIPQRWLDARPESTGWYAVEATVGQSPKAGDAIPLTKKSRYRAQRFLTVFADVCRDGWVSDWTTHTVRVSSETDEGRRAGDLARLVKDDLMAVNLQVHDREKWVEVNAEAVMPTRPRAGKPLSIRFSILRVEDDRGNDWMEDVELVLQSQDRDESVRLPVAAGKYVTAARASVTKSAPDRCVVVTSERSALFDLIWPAPKAGRWQLRLRYRYSDDYHIKDTDRLLRDDPFAQGTFEVAVDL